MGLYIHIPFCRAKCAYCDFSSFAGLQSLHQPYVQALLRELHLVAESLGCPAVDTIYVGGGTPTVLPAQELAQVLDACQRAFDVSPDAEITLEANPGTVSAGSLDVLVRAGVNRLSLGAQSLQDGELRMLGRIHNVAEVSQAVIAARAASLRNINLDLIYGLPGQSLNTWSDSLERALELAPQHLSLYALSVEDGTPLADAIAAGALPAPDADLAADMYIHADRRLDRAGFAHFELSNWALAREAGSPASYECRHNLKYWNVTPYVGLGAGAHSYVGQRRYANVSEPREYIDRLQTDRSPLETEERISPAESMAETMILGLRLRQGVSDAGFAQRHGRPMSAQYPEQLSELHELGLLQRDDVGVRLTERGRLLANQVFVRFWPT